MLRGALPHFRRPLLSMPLPSSDCRPTNGRLLVLRRWLVPRSKLGICCCCKHTMLGHGGDMRQTAVCLLLKAGEDDSMSAGTEPA